jgi:hypothetical protein
MMILIHVSRIGVQRNRVQRIWKSTNGYNRVQRIKKSTNGKVELV